VKQVGGFRGITIIEGFSNSLLREFS